jgi:hypothetical protein
MYGDDPPGEGLRMVRGLSFLRNALPKGREPV